jgi:hypothetical protein
MSMPNHTSSERQDMVGLIEIFLLLIAILLALIALLSDMGPADGFFLALALALVSWMGIVLRDRHLNNDHDEIAPKKDAVAPKKEKEEVGSFRPPREEEFKRIYELDKTVFKARDIIPFATFLHWFRANRHTFIVLSVEGKTAGYYSILPLRTGTLQKFLKGEIGENEFQGNDILSEQEAQGLKEILFFSMVCDKDHREYGRQLLQHAIGEVRERRIYPELERVYAAASTVNGQKVLQRIGFLKISEGHQRRDGHMLYEYHMA